MITNAGIDAPLFEQLEPRTFLSAISTAAADIRGLVAPITSHAAPIATAAEDIAGVVRPIASPAVPIAPPALDIVAPAVSGRSVVGALATTTPLVVSTIPSNGDVNPYGAAFVPRGFKRGGPLKAGDLLVSNFNASGNLQGTGTTIVRITPSGELSTFFEGTGPLGLTAALGILKGGFVIVGNMPTTNGTFATVEPGSLLVINRFGVKVAEFTDADLINGPWGLTISEHGRHAQLFLSNVLTGTVSRFDLQIGNKTVKITGSAQIASGFAHSSDPSALVLGPTGLAFDDRTGTLFVASTADNAVFAVADADITQKDNGTGTIVFDDQLRLHGPLGLVLAPNGDLIVANGDAVNADPNQPSEIVEFTQKGTFVSQFSINSGAAAPFGIAISTDKGRVKFAAVDDDLNAVDIWNLDLRPSRRH